MRKSIRPLIALTAALALTVTAGMSALAQADNNEKHFSVIEAASNEDSLTIPEIAKKCGTSVVAIETETKVVYNTYDNDYYNPFGGMFGYGFGYGYGNRGGRGGTQEYTQKAAGSGVIISEDGYVLTNNHVISGADKITVYVNPGDGSEEKSYEATLIGSSESNDIAVLKIDATGLNAAAFGDSDQLEVGELAVAIGNPMGQVHGSVTAGIISAVEQELTIDDVTINAIQTDAAINPGNSGGALVNTYGQVIGINSQKIAATDYEGIGFAISINEAQPIINDLIQYGYVRGRVVMGITMQMIDQTYAAIYGYQPGIGVVSVEAGSPAEEAGLVAGDIITAIDGQSITTQEELNTLLEQYSPGDTITLTVYRQSVRGDGQELSMELTFAEAGAPSDTTTQQSSQQSTQQSQAQNESSTSPWSWMFQ